ncbi:hypothetical protein [Paenibacillus lautus]|uniref:hypothetical protein n=1 Tax=Paenibacillus lautus TaxID=1401 RepID=UPI003D2DE9FF
MNIKKMLGVFVLCSSMLPGVGYAASNSVTSISGKIQTNVVAHIESVTDSELESMNKIAAVDNLFKVIPDDQGGITVIREYPAQQGMVFVNDEEVLVDENGGYSVNVESGETTIEVRSIDGEVLKSRKLSTKQVNSVSLNIIDNQDFGDLIESMDEANGITENSGMSTYAMYPGQTYNGQPVYTGDHVHCNRLNGVFSDHKYWVYKSSPVAALQNFYMSDCDYALISWGCDTWGGDTTCDGLGVNTTSPYNCSLHKSWPVTVWWRN